MSKYLLKNAFGIEGFHIAWYGVLTAVGILGSMIVAYFFMRRRSLSWELLVDGLLMVLPFGYVGARAYYVVFNWQEYAGNLLKIINIRDGGQALYGSLIGGILGALLFCIIKKVPFFYLSDAMLPGMLVGQIVGRWGNFINQEAYGQLITDTGLMFFPYGVFIENLGEWHQATFFYEGTWNFVVLVILIVCDRRIMFFREKSGLPTACYLIGYGAGRFWIESLRTDSLMLSGNIRVSQLLSLILVLVGGFIFWYRYKYGKAYRYSGKYMEH